jgi:DNA-binding MarR family transcriptional regulator
LLDILKITKQSLSRVLGQLVAEDYIQQKKGMTDRRQRLLSLTGKGKELERVLTENQRQRIAKAYRAAGPGAVEGFRAIMLGIITHQQDRDRFEDQGAD